MERGILTVISGFSGAGKGTIMRELIQRYDYFLSVSATTRSPRAGEVDGKDYYFHTKEQFQQMLVKEQFPDALLIFISPPSASVLRERLMGRGTESPEEIEKRLLRAVEEVKYMKDYDYIIVNDELEDAIKKINDLIQYDHYKACNSSLMIEKMEREIREVCSAEGRVNHG